MLSACPCGCMTKPPWFDDPACVRHKPAAVPDDWDRIRAELHALPPLAVIACTPDEHTGPAAA